MSPVVPDVLPRQRHFLAQAPGAARVVCQFSDSCAVSTKEINLQSVIAANLHVLESNAII